MSVIPTAFARLVRRIGGPPSNAAFRSDTPDESFFWRPEILHCSVRPHEPHLQEDGSLASVRAGRRVRRACKRTSARGACSTERARWRDEASRHFSRHQRPMNALMEVAVVQHAALGSSIALHSLQIPGQVALYPPGRRRQRASRSRAAQSVAAPRERSPRRPAEDSLRGDRHTGGGEDRCLQFVEAALDRRGGACRSAISSTTLTCRCEVILEPTRDVIRPMSSSDEGVTLGRRSCDISAVKEMRVARVSFSFGGRVVGFIRMSSACRTARRANRRPAPTFAEVQAKRDIPSCFSRRSTVDHKRPKACPSRPPAGRRARRASRKSREVESARLISLSVPIRR